MNLNTHLNIILTFCCSIFLLLTFSCAAQPASSNANTATPLQGDSLQKTDMETLVIYPGANQTDLYFPLLKDKKIAVVGNQTSVIFHDPTYQKQTHLVDFLLEQNFEVVKVFSPEHGFRGDADAGEKVNSNLDAKTGLPIISLYGNNKKPKAEQLKSVDIVIFDLQDVGVRFYTYISTMHYVMEICAELNIPIIVLDRPNPNIDIVDGPVLEKAHTSFIGMHQVPVLYGLSIGEYAKMIQGEKWISQHLDLTVIPCKNYTRKSSYALPIAPSPNLRTDNSIAWYASLCLFEGTVVSVGRGTAQPFEHIGHPEFPNKNYSFTPTPGFGAKNPLLNGQKCYGINFSDSIAPRKLNLDPLLSFYQALPNKNNFFLKNNFINLLAGNSALKTQIASGLSEDEIRLSWQEDIDVFLKTRAKYLIYQ